MPQAPSSWSFNEDYWDKVITKPDWHMEFVPYAKQTTQGLSQSEKEQFNKTVRRYFEKALQENRVTLASSGPDLDKQRGRVDTIVIHHTSGKPGYRLSYMEATQLLNIYAPYYGNPTIKEERGLKGQAIWSNHFREGRQTFLCYHWLMRMDGSFERLLADDKIGWHAGNWDINKKSIGICLDNDYENQDPTDEILRKLAAHIKQNYPQVKSNKIIGHQEARTGTICPGTNFLVVWKPKLLEALEA